MTRPRRLAALALALAACATLAHAGTTTRYAVQELLAPGGAEASLVQAFAISAHTGLVAGDAQAVGDTTLRGVVWRDGIPRRELASGQVLAFPRGVNDVGHSVGYTEDGDLLDRPAFWSSTGRLHLLPTFQPGAWAEALAISNTDDVVGFDGSIGGPVLWHQRTEQALPMPAGLSWGSANAISHRGTHIAGYVGDGGSIIHAAVWADGQVHRVGPPGTTSWGYGVNEAGQVIGSYRNLSNADTPFIATTDRYATLPMLPQHSQALPSAISDAGIVVGTSWCGCGGNSVAVRWSGGQVMDLNDALDAAARAAGWHLIAASAIDESGRILAAATRGNSNWSTVLLVPQAQ